ncbi:hypothetical protein SH528x_001156 [Novipirellula sp. SH528]|uniref:hypothetical protein n=1 Tax=Novipirellula sp. SH528 TaxID=3454466 RepID=UPI003FA0E890
MKTIASQLLEPSNDVTWLVCEQGSRWADAARRFSPEDLSDPWIPAVISCEAADIPNRIAGNRMAKLGPPRRIPMIVLWELTPQSIAGQCRVITQLRLAFPTVIQLAGLTRIPGSIRTVISELGVSIMLPDPEALQNVARTINQRAFLATASLG